jgi:hypothetical protein
VSLDLFDDPTLDRALASGLSALAPYVDPVDVTLAELKPLFRQARTRRRVVRGSAAVAVLLLVGSVALATVPSARRAHVTVESPARRSVKGTVPKNSSVQPSAKRAKSPAVGSATARPPATSSSHVNISPSTKPAVVRPTAGPSTAGAATAPPQTAPRSTVPGAQSRRFYSSGGSIVVSLDHGRLRLVGVSPVKGYSGDVRVRSAQTVDVWFTRKGRRASEVEVSIVDGHMAQIEGSHDTWSWSGASAAAPVTGQHAPVRSPIVQAAGTARSSRRFAASAARGQAKKHATHVFRGHAHLLGATNL